MKKVGIFILLSVLVLALWLWPRPVDEPLGQVDPSAMDEPAALFVEEQSSGRDSAESSLATDDSDGPTGRQSPLPVLNEGRTLTVWQALEGQDDLLEALEQDLMAGRLSAEAFEEERGLWSAICESVLYPERQPPDLRTDIPLAFIRRMEYPCQSFTPALLDQIDEEMAAEFDMSLEEAEHWQRQDRLFQLVSQGDRETARALVFEQLLDALQSQSMSSAVWAAWQLQQHGLIDFPDELAVPEHGQIMIDLIVPTAAALALTCAQIGGCSDNHPLVISLCVWPGRGPCQPPLDLYQAIDQLLTGSEIQYFNHLLDEVERELRERVYAESP